MTELAPDFTLARYRQLLRIARDAGYRFVGFAALEAATDAAIAVRHDIGYALRWVAPMAEIEAGEGVAATYCFQPDSLTYQLDSEEGEAAVAFVAASGHEVGLHFDASTIDDDDEVVVRVGDAAEAMSARFGVAIRVVSFHMPGRRPVGHLELPDGLLNTYAPTYHRDIGYVSDSNQDWRGKDLAALLRERRHSRLQVLIHPVWWRVEPGTMLAKLDELARDTGVTIESIITPEQRALIR